MKKIRLISHSKGALGLRLFGLGPNLFACNGLKKLKNLLDFNTDWAKDRSINDLKKCLAKSDVIISLWIGREIVGFGRALSDDVYRGILWDVVIDKNYQGFGYGKVIVNKLIQSNHLQKVEKIYLMTSNKKTFYSQLGFEEVSSQTLLLKKRVNS